MLLQRHMTASIYMTPYIHVFNIHIIYIAVYPMWAHISNKTTFVQTEASQRVYAMVSMSADAYGLRKGQHGDSIQMRMGSTIAQRFGGNFAHALCVCW